MTFGGTDATGYSLGQVGVDDARELVAVAIDAGINLIDTADVYSGGLSEEVLGKALGSRRDEVLIATKLNQRTVAGPNDVGQSRHHIVSACEASLRRLGTDHVDLYHVHGFDPETDVEESLSALDDLVHAGKVRAIGCSNLSGWHLMKSLAASE
jgi:aryl-alcohol dehydrogenase-like predicted oxidoreductase